MRNSFVAILCVGSAVGTDPCDLLCSFDGPSVCKHGSWTKPNGVCHAYLFTNKANNEYCYHTSETRETCPSRGMPVMASDVDTLLRAGRTSTTTEGPSTSTMSAEEYPEAPSESDFWNHLESRLKKGLPSLVRRISLVERVMENFIDSDEDPIVRWKAMKGHMLLSTASIDSEWGPFSWTEMVMSALVIAQEINAPDRESFLLNSGLTVFCRENAERIENSLLLAHKRIWNERPFVVNGGMRAPILMRSAFLRNMERLCPEIRESVQLKGIALAHNLYGTSAGFFVWPREPIVNKATAFHDSREILLRAPNYLQGLKRVVLSNGAPGRGESDVLKEWFAAVARSLLHGTDPLLRLERAQFRGGYQEVLLNNLIVDDEAFRALGRFMGLALLKRNPVRILLPTWFYSVLAGNEITIDDIREDYDGLYHFLLNIQNAESDEVLRNIPFFLDGAYVVPTMANRESLISRKLASVVPANTRAQFAAVQLGFSEMVSRDAMRRLNISGPELRLLISGQRLVTANDIIARMLYGVVGGAKAEQVAWLHRFIRNLNQDFLGEFLFFVYGNTQVSLEGLAPLHVVFTSEGSDESLPVADWQRRSLDIYRYSSEAILKSRLNQALDI
jgi:hypothetical protein